MDHYDQNNSASNCSKGFKKITQLIKKLCPSNPESVIYCYLFHCKFRKSILKSIQSSLENKDNLISHFMKEYLDRVGRNDFKKVSDIFIKILCNAHQFFNKKL